LSNLGKYKSQNPLKRALLRRFLTRAHAAVPDTSDLSILDVGTGEGLFWDELPNRVVGIDIRHHALVKAAEKGSVAPVIASAESLPFPTGGFEFVLAIEILEHLPNPDAAVAEMARVSRVGGLVTVPWEPWFSLMVLAGSGRHLRRIGRELEHFQAFGPGELEGLLQPHFESVHVSTCLPWLIARVS